VTLTEIAERLGTAASSLASLAALRIEAIRARTRRDLLDVARWLELKGASRLPKNELATCILDALKERARAAVAEAEKVKAARAETAKKVEKGKPAPPAPPSPKKPQPSAKKAPPPREAEPPPEPEDLDLREGEDPSGTAKLDLGPAGKAEKPVTSQ
jgi:hypothetical protein